MKQPLVSVVIPAFNAEKYIATCIDSVLAQSYSNFEIVVVDDGSTDNTIDLISEYKNPRIKTYSQVNSGSASARNHGVQKASGEWIAFIDSDDIWTTDKLQKQLEQCADCAWSHTDSYFLGGIYEEHTKASDLSEKHSGEIFSRLLVENFIGTSCVMIKKAIFQEIGGFSSSYRALQDWDLWIRVAAKYQICYIAEPLVYYRVHPESTSRFTRKTLPYHLSLIDRTFSKEGVAFRHQQLKPSALSTSFEICSQISEQEEDFIFSCYCAFQSLVNQPKHLSRYFRLIKILIKSAIHYIKLPFRRAAKSC